MYGEYILDNPPIIPEKKPKHIVNFFSKLGLIFLKLNPKIFIIAEKMIDTFVKKTRLRN